jgi:hypothetical protein
MDTRTTLAKSDRTNRETFYFLTMTADLAGTVRIGDEMTEAEVRVVFKKEGHPDSVAIEAIENARRMNSKGGSSPSETPSHDTPAPICRIHSVGPIKKKASRPPLFITLASKRRLRVSGVSAPAPHFTGIALMALAETLDWRGARQHTSSGIQSNHAGGTDRVGIRRPDRSGARVYVRAFKVAPALGTRKGPAATRTLLLKSPVE